MSWFCILRFLQCFVGSVCMHTRSLPVECFGLTESIHACMIDCRVKKQITAGGFLQLHMHHLQQILVSVML